MIGFSESRRVLAVAHTLPFKWREEFIALWPAHTPKPPWLFARDSGYGITLYALFAPPGKARKLEVHLYRMPFIGARARAWRNRRDAHRVRQAVHACRLLNLAFLERHEWIVDRNEVHYVSGQQAEYIAARVTVRRAP